MKSLNNIKIEYPTQAEIDNSISRIYQRILPKRQSYSFRKYIYAFSCVFVFVIVLSFLFQSINNNKEEKKPKIDYSQLNQYVNAYYADNIFIGRIADYESQSSDISYYKVMPLFNLKGDTKSYENIIYDEKKVGQSSLPIKNEVYIFILNRDVVNKSYFRINESYDIKQLPNYDINKSPYSQEDKIVDIIRNVEQAIEKPVTSTFYKFLVENNLDYNKIQYDYKYQIGDFDLRIYYILDQYYLYYSNKSLIEYTLKYTNSQGESIIMIIPENREGFTEISFYDTSDIATLKLNEKIIGTIEIRTQKK